MPDPEEAAFVVDSASPTVVKSSRGGGRVGFGACGGGLLRGNAVFGAVGGCNGGGGALYGSLARGALAAGAWRFPQFKVGGGPFGCPHPGGGCALWNRVLPVAEPGGGGGKKGKCSDLK